MDVLISTVSQAESCTLDYSFESNFLIYICLSITRLLFHFFVYVSEEIMIDAETKCVTDFISTEALASSMSSVV